jgi:hypothetical protein
MPAVVSLLTPLVTVEPGTESVAELRIRNTGGSVDQFACNLVGEAGAWARCEPPVVSLFPNAEETVRVVFAPPRSAAISAGTIAFGVRVTSKEDAAFSQVEEGTVQVGGFSAVGLRVVPRTSEGKRLADHRVELTNTGNAPVTASITALDPDDILVFKITPSTIEVPAGGTAVAKLALVSREHAKGGLKRRPFNVTVEVGGAPAATTDAAFEQKPKANVLIWLAVVAVAAVLVVLLKDQAEGAVLESGQAAATVSAATHRAAHPAAAPTPPR